MLLNEYQELAFKTAMETAKNPAYMISNLTSEAGEVAGKYAKRLGKNYFAVFATHMEWEKMVGYWGLK